MLVGRTGLPARTWNRVKRIAVKVRKDVRDAAVRFDNRARGGLPVPSATLISLVAGSDDIYWFLESGRRAAQSVRGTLEKNRIRLEDLGAVLDFGCGIGRVMRHWNSVKGPSFLGTDYNANLITWCQQNLPFARFQTNELVGKLGYDDGRFDLIYVLSVFTHLTEDQQLHWIVELSRTLLPGGYLLISTHGKGHCQDLLPEDRERFQNGELIVYGAQHAGSNVCTTFHPEKYIREKLAKDWIVADFIPEGALGNPRQDVYLLRKPFQ